MKLKDRLKNMRLGAKKVGARSTEILTTNVQFKNYGIEREVLFHAPFKKASATVRKQFAAEKGDLMIRGHASTNDLDRVDDIITLGALNKAKDQLLKSGASTVFFNHDTDFPVGLVVGTEMDSKGLIVTVFISKAPDVESVRIKLKEKVLNSFSIRARFKKVQVERDKHGHIISVKVLELELFEVSVVGLPMNPGADIFEVMEKSMSHLTGSDTKGRRKKKPKKRKNRKPKIKEKTVSKKAKKTKKKSKKKAGDQPVTIKQVGEMITEGLEVTLAPIAKSFQVTQDAVISLVKKDKKNKKKTGKKSKKKKDKKKKAGEIPEWLKGFEDGISKLTDAMTSKRKGYQRTDDDDDDDDDGGVKKCLKAADDVDTLKFVIYAVENDEVYEALEDSEKRKCKDFWMAAQLAAQVKD